MPATELRICENCNKTVIGSCFCNYVPGAPVNYDFPTMASELIKRGRALWAELHSKQNPTPEWFADWVSRVPNFECKCRNWLNKYLETNPPRYDDFYEWSVECHDAVNTKRKVAPWDRVS